MARKTLQYSVDFSIADLPQILINPPSGYEWSVEHIGINTNSAQPTQCTVSRNNVFVCGSESGNLDSADGAPILLKDGDELELLWINVQDTPVCTALLIVTETERGSR